MSVITLLIDVSTYVAEAPSDNVGLLAFKDPAFQLAQMGRNPAALRTFPHDLRAITHIAPVPQEGPLVLFAHPPPKVLRKSALLRRPNKMVTQMQQGRAF
jgi:hypothetical protein